MLSLLSKIKLGILQDLVCGSGVNPVFTPIVAILIVCFLIYFLCNQSRQSHKFLKSSAWCVKDFSMTIIKYLTRDVQNADLRSAVCRRKFGMVFVRAVKLLILETWLYNTSMDKDPY